MVDGSWSTRHRPSTIDHPPNEASFLLYSEVMKMTALLSATLLLLLVACTQETQTNTTVGETSTVSTSTTTS
jgi:hypothetical protein